MAQFNTINTVGLDREESYRTALTAESTRDFSPEINGVSVGLSSGTSGVRGLFLTSRRERAIWVGAVLDRVIGWSFKKRSVAFFLRANNNLYEAVNSKLLAFRFYDLKIRMEDHLPDLECNKPDILVAQPSVMLELAKAKLAGQCTIAPSRLISVAEVLEDDYRKTIEAAFGVRVDQVYQCTEGFLGYTCTEGRMHLNEDWLEIERHFIDDEGVRFHPIITDYLRYSQPVVRYELNDILHLGAACSCGNPSTVVDRIEGRSDDIFYLEAIDGQVIRMYPDFIRRAVVTADCPPDDFAVYQVTGNRIELDLRSGDDAVSDEIFDSVHDNLTKLFMDFGLHDVEIRRTRRFNQTMNKFRRIQNENHTKHAV